MPSTEVTLSGLAGVPARLAPAGGSTAGLDACGEPRAEAATARVRSSVAPCLSQSLIVDPPTSRCADRTGKNETNTTRRLRLRGICALLGAPGRGSRGCALDRGPDPSLRCGSRDANLLPPFGRETIRVASDSAVEAESNPLAPVRGRRRGRGALGALTIHRPSERSPASKRMP